MLSFATIVYDKDYPLLELQARSLAQFADSAIVGSISVILNHVNEQALEQALTPLLTAYGPLRSKVRLVRGDDILRANDRRTSPRLLERLYVDYRKSIPFVRRQGWRGNNGYRLQQALKLASARCAATDRMVLLDTKNVFLRPLQEFDFFGDDGRARVALLKPEAVFHRNWLGESLSALGQSIQVDEIEQTTTFATPYPVRRDLVLALLNEIDQRYGSVQALFASKRRPSEFMLINAFCLAQDGGIETFFERADPVNIGIWPDYPVERIEMELEKLENPDALCLGLHNRAVIALRADHKSRLLAALENRGLCSAREAQDILLQTGGLNA